MDAIKKKQFSFPSRSISTLTAQRQPRQALCLHLFRRQWRRLTQKWQTVQQQTGRKKLWKAGATAGKTHSNTFPRFFYQICVFGPIFAQAGNTGGEPGLLPSGQDWPGQGCRGWDQGGVLSRCWQFGFETPGMFPFRLYNCTFRQEMSQGWMLNMMLNRKLWRLKTRGRTCFVTQSHLLPVLWSMTGCPVVCGWYPGIFVSWYLVWLPISLVLFLSSSCSGGWKLAIPEAETRFRFWSSYYKYRLPISIWK